jgi:alpha-glucosidase
VWISPFYPSPQADAGHDVADYLGVDPLFGSLADADQLIASAHQLGLRVVLDVVPNHTSDEHAWLQEALAAGPGSPKRARYWFRESDGLPNNWLCEFGGPARTQVPDGQWYLHMFDRKQPDLNWENPEVRDMFLDVLRFWLERGVDGFRVDVAQALVTAEALPDFQVTCRPSSTARSPRSPHLSTTRMCTMSADSGGACWTAFRAIGQWWPRRG